MSTGKNQARPSFTGQPQSYQPRPQTVHFTYTLVSSPAKQSAPGPAPNFAGLHALQDAPQPHGWGDSRRQCVLCKGPVSYRPALPVWWV